MKTGFFRPRCVGGNKGLAPTVWLGLMFLVFLGIPAESRSKSQENSDGVPEICVESFLSILADYEQRGVPGNWRGAQLKPARELSEECVDSFVEFLADYEERYQLQRGKPPPPPPDDSTNGPLARAWHAFVGNGSAASDASRLYLFAGAGSDWQPVPGDLWYYKVPTEKWILAPAGSTKPGRRQHVGFSCGAGQCVTSNGSNGFGWLKETWVYTEASGSWSQINCKRNLCPSARGMPTMVYDPARAYHVLFGGSDGSVSLDDTFTFAGGRWTARNPATVPEARNRAAAAFVGAPYNRVVLHGGQQDGTAALLCDMYTWTGSNWQTVNDNGGPCLHSHSMAWDGSRLIVTGGYENTSDTPSNDVWYFSFSGPDSGSWSLGADGLAECAPDAKPGARMAYDVPSKTKVFFGGEANGSTGIVRYDDTVICQ